MGEHQHEEPDEEYRADSNEKPSTDRRRFLKLTGAGALAFGGVGFGASAAAAQEDGPPNPDDWSLEFEDDFDSDSLDESVWGVGWGWGDTSDASDGRIVSDNVYIEDSTLLLEGSHDGDEILAGGVHTKGSVEFGPGSYVEARLRFPARVGFHPAFWAQPVTDQWPPEFDIAEVLQDGSGEDDTHTSRHFIHYTTSTEPGDASTQERFREFYEPGDDITENFHVYGAEWQDDGITYYVDGEEIANWTDSTMLESFQNGAPFYLMLNMNINVDSELNEYLGQADLSESWGETFDADWVRVWEQ